MTTSLKNIVDKALTKVFQKRCLEQEVDGYCPLPCAEGDEECEEKKKECDKAACGVLDHNPFRYCPGSLMHKTLQTVYEVVFNCKDPWEERGQIYCETVRGEKKIRKSNKITAHILNFNPFMYCPGPVGYRILQEIYKRVNHCEGCAHMKKHEGMLKHEYISDLPDHDEVEALKD